MIMITILIMMMMMMMTTIIVHMLCIHIPPYPAPVVSRPMGFDDCRCKRVKNSKPSNIPQLQTNCNSTEFEQQKELGTFFAGHLVLPFGSWGPGIGQWYHQKRQVRMDLSQWAVCLLTRKRGMSFSETIQARDSPSDGITKFCPPENYWKIVIS